MKAFFLFLICVHVTVVNTKAQTESCPLPFPQDQLNQQLGKIICAAANDFAGVQGEQDYNSDYNTFWKIENVTIDGTSDMFISLDNTGKTDNPKKELVMMFSCPDMKNKEQITTFFELLRDAVNKVRPSCGSLKQHEPIDDLRPDLLKTIIWEGEVAGSTKMENVLVELDLNFFGGEYYVNLHVART